MSDTTTEHELSEPNARSVFLHKLLDQVGTPFRQGVEVDLDDAKPASFDASELIEWAAAQAGVDAPDGSVAQYDFLGDNDSTMDIEEAIRTEGALLFRFTGDPDGDSESGEPIVGHVAVSLGDGRVVEATVGEHEIVRVVPHGDRFTHAGELPGLVGVELPVDDSLALWRKTDRLELDQDQDRLHDATEEARWGSAPGVTDSDGDGVSDLATAQINFFDDMVDRHDLDADRDGLLDAAEIRLGTDPNRFDTDGDGMDDHLEIMTGTDPTVFNSSIFAMSDEGQAVGLHEDHAAQFGTHALREHLQYLRMEADPTDPRVSDVFRENFHLYGRQPDVSDEAAFDAWFENYESVEAGFEVEEEVTAPEAAAAPAEAGGEVTAEPTEAATVEDAPAAVDAVELSIPEPEPVAGFEELDDDLQTIEADLLDGFADLELPSDIEETSFGAELDI